MSAEEELRAVAKIVDRLAERFPHIPRQSIERAVLEEHKALDGRPIRDYVPVLVERGAKGRLRGHVTTSQALTAEAATDATAAAAPAAAAATDRALAAPDPAAQRTDFRS